MLDTGVKGKLQLDFAISENHTKTIKTMDEPLIKVDQVDKVYRIWSNPRSRLTGAFARRMANNRVVPGPLRNFSQRHHTKVCREFYALRNINIRIGKGETIGIIGRNGSGKSTVLKIIAGTLRPTTGEVSVRGRVAAMLELGSGFEQEFTGRDNVYLSASILGLTEKETQQKFQSIIDFADIGDFLDQPVKTYSSGMLVRLAFAVHTAVDPEILIIDEALSVGDETFRRKCFARLESLKEKGTTLLFVSHDLGSVVSLTERAFFFHEGEIVKEGAPKEVVETYQRYCHGSKAQMAKMVEGLKQQRLDELSGKSKRASIDGLPDKELPSNAEGRPSGVYSDAGEGFTGEGYDPHFKSDSITNYPQNGGEICDLSLLNEAGKPVNILERRKRYYFEYTIRCSQTCRDVTFAMLIKTLKGLELGGSRVLPWDHFIEKVTEGEVYKVRFGFETLLMPGVYFLNAGAEGIVEGKRSYIHRVLDALVFRVLSEKDLMPTGLVDFRIEPEMQKLEQ